MKWCLWTQPILTLTLWKTVAMSDLTTTSRPAMQQPQTDQRNSPQNILKPGTGCVSVSFSWPGFQAVHSSIWLCALAYRLACTCGRRTIWEDLIWFILLVFKNILLYVATSLICRRNCIQGKCDVSSFCPTHCGWNFKLVGQQQVILRGVEFWIPVIEAIWNSFFFYKAFYVLKITNSALSKPYLHTFPFPSPLLLLFCLHSHWSSESISPEVLHACVYSWSRPLRTWWQVL